MIEVFRSSVFYLFSLLENSEVKKTKKEMLSVLAVFAVVGLFLAPNSAAAFKPMGMVGFDGAGFAHDPYYYDDEMNITYAHWDTGSSMYIYLYDPSGTLKQTWHPARNYPNIDHYYPSLDGAMSGKWRLYMTSTTSGTTNDYAAVGYYEIDYVNDWNSYWGNSTTKKVAIYDKMQSDDAYGVTGGVAFHISQYTLEDEQRRIEVRSEMMFQDNDPSSSNEVYDMTLYVEKVRWSSGTYGRYYGSTGVDGSIYNSGITIENTQHFHGASDNMSYPDNHDYVSYIGDYAIAGASAIAAGGWTFAFTGAYLTAKMLTKLSTSGSNPDSCPIGTGDLDASAHWHKNGIFTSWYNATTFNWLDLYLFAGDTSYCFKFWAEITYFYFRPGIPPDTQTETTQPIYLCVT
ncbi:MAG: hypothetical protein ACTSX2_05350 [Candidatus Thorarchaeota archaeon]